MMPNGSPNNNWLIYAIALVLVCGLLVLSFSYEDSRMAFADVAKLVLGGCIGFLLPHKSGQ